MAQAPVAKNGNQAAPPPAVAQMSIEAALKLIQAEGPRGFPGPLRGCPKGHRSPRDGRRLRSPGPGGRDPGVQAGPDPTKKPGTLVQPVPGGPFAVSAQGYEVWQEAAGACVIFPSEVLVDGKWQAQPRRDQGSEERAYPDDLRSGGCVPVLVQRYPDGLRLDDHLRHPFLPHD